MKAMKIFVLLGISIPSIYGLYVLNEFYILAVFGLISLMTGLSILFDI